MTSVGPVGAAELGGDLDTMAYGAVSDPTKTAPNRASRKGAGEARVMEAAPSQSSAPAFQENSPGLLAILGFDTRNFGPVPPRAAVPLEAQARAEEPAPVPASAPVLDENAPGLLAAFGLDNRVVVAGPAPRLGPPEEAYARIAAPPPIVVASRSSEYRLGAGDKLRVVVFGQEGLTNTYAIDASGAITMPLIGRVSARGHTPGALAEDITARLRKGFIREPSVAVEIESYRPFFILGEVAAPGQYPYVPNMSVESAVAIAGGFSPRARRDSVTVTHPAEGGLLRAVVPLGTPLSPGDTIMVSERWF